MNPEVDPNPPQSLGEIIQERITNDKRAASQKARVRARYRRAIQNGFLAGLLVAALAGVIFLIKSAI